MRSEKDSARGIGNNPSLPYLLGLCCLGLILFAIALTVVIALIPTYLPDKGDGISKVNATSMESWLHAQAATTTSGKRAAADSLDTYVGCQFGASGREQVRQVLRQCLVSPLAKDVTVTSVNIAYTAGSKKKRSALGRDARASDVLSYVIGMIFSYDSDCLYGCQTKIGNNIQSCLYNLPPGNFAFNDVPLLRDGVLVYTASRLRTLRIAFVSAILSSLSPFRPGSGPATRATTPSTATAATTAMSG
ncbi:unnamed protein product [Adineta ricciae]|uniref:Uncharacterized protein n=1 Tax=Adineta ricciae TaxID=249248 RepID=A0A814M8M3_ADIRI|nr:unnamed protein product [Adineta ricciae]CAF1152083.1 unnamed protein product [Adineta ricciae]